MPLRTLAALGAGAATDLWPWAPFSSLPSGRDLPRRRACRLAYGSSAVELKHSRAAGLYMLAWLSCAGQAELATCGRPARRGARRGTRRGAREGRGEEGARRGARRGQREGRGEGRVRRGAGRGAGKARGGRGAGKARGARLSRGRDEGIGKGRGCLTNVGVLEGRGCLRARRGQGEGAAAATGGQLSVLLMRLGEVERRGARLSRGAAVEGRGCRGARLSRGAARGAAVEGRDATGRQLCSCRRLRAGL